MQSKSDNGPSAVNALMARPLLSRRALFSLTAIVGGLHLVGSTTVGNAVVNAYADDAGNSSFVVVVLKKDEIGAMVIDAAAGGEPLANAHVKVTSWFNGKTAEKDTDELGVAVLSVRDLAENAEDDDAAHYEFFAAGEVTLAGYREFAFLEQFMISGPCKSSQKAHILLPTQPYHAASDGAYLRCACFDGADMLYSDCDMPKFASNDATHTAAFQVVCAKGETVSCTFLADDAAVGSASAKATEAGYATVEVSGAFVKDLPMATEFKVKFTAGGLTKICTLRLRIREPKNDVVDPYMSENWCMSPGHGAGEDKGGSYDGGVPSASPSENDVTPFMPMIVDLPVMPWGKFTTLITLPWSRTTLALTPAGGVGVMWRSQTYSVLHPKEGPAIDPTLSYKERSKQLSEAATEAWENAWEDDMSEGIDKFHEARQQAQNAKRAVGAKGFGGCDVTYQYSLSLLANVLDAVSEEERKAREEAEKAGKPQPKHDYHWGGTVRGAFSLLFAGEYGAQVSVGPVPVILGADFYIFAQPALETGVQFKAPFRDPKWILWEKGVHGEGGFSIDISGELGLNAGVGVRGLASVGVRGYARFPLFIGFTKPPEGKSFPRFKADAIVGIQGTAQVLFVKIRADIVKPWEWHLYDNWKGAAELDADDAGRALSANEFYRDPALGAALSEGTDYVMSYTYDSNLLETSAKTNRPVAEVSATLNDEGVLCQIDTTGVALPSANAMATQGFIDPFDTESDSSYDPRKGLKPLIQTPFTSGGGIGGTGGTGGSNGSNGSGETDQYSDPRVHIVQLGDKLYYCRIAVMAVSTGGGVNLDCVAVADSQCNEGSSSCVVEGSGNDFFFTPLEGAELPQMTYKAGTDGRPGSLNAPRYGEVELYADDNSSSAVVQASVCVPVYACVGERPANGADDAKSVDNDAAALDLRAKAIAVAMGDTDAAPANASGLLGDSQAIRDGVDKLQGCAVTNEPASRTRVIVTPFDLATREWGATDMIDFSLPSSAIETMRCNMNDVDFSVKAQDGMLLFGVVSVSKPLRKKRDIESMKKTLFTSAVRYQPAEGGGHGKVIDAYCNVLQTIGENYYEWKAEPVLINRAGSGAAKTYLGLVATGARGTYEGKPHNCIVSHFYPLAATGEQAASAGEQATATGEQATSANVSPNDEPNVFVLYPDKTHLIDDNGMLQAFVQKRTGTTDALVVSWEYRPAPAESTPVTAQNQRSSLWSIDTDGEGEVLGGGPRDFTGAECYTVLGADKGIGWLERNEGGTEVKLMNVRMGEDGLPLAAVDLGNVETGSFFTSGNADYLYSVRVKEGSALAQESDDAQRVRDSLAAGGAVYGDISGFMSPDAGLDALSREGADPEVKHYQMTACRWDPKYKKYREIFPFAQLDQAPDEISAFPLPATSATLGGTSVVYSTITDLDSQRGALTLAEVPAALALAFESVICLDNFIGPGWTVHPTVRVANVGNLPICAFTVEFRDKDDNLLGTHRVANLHEKVVDPLRPIHEEEARQLVASADASYEQLRDNFGSIDVADEEQYTEEAESILWPGSTRNYRTEFKTPEDWSGEHEVFVRIVQDKVETPDFGSAGSPMFDNEERYVTMVDNAVRSCTISQDESQNVAAETKPVYYYGENNIIPDEGGGVTPATGDAASHVVAAAAAAAVAAGAVAAKLHHGVQEPVEEDEREGQ